MDRLRGPVLRLAQKAPPLATDQDTRMMKNGRSMTNDQHKCPPFYRVPIDRPWRPASTDGFYTTSQLT